MSLRFLLDTNACVTHLRSEGRSPLSLRLIAQDPREIALCSVVKAELVRGILRTRNIAANRAKLSRFMTPFASLPFDDAAAEAYAVARNAVEAAGAPIGPNDLLIAAIALANDLTLVTHNLGEFSRVPGLRCEDWEAA